MNKSKRILILSQWFDPEPTFKGLLFAQELRRLGHEVQVLTGFPNYPGGDVYPGYRVRPFTHEKIDGIDVVRTWLYPSHDGSGIRRALNYLSFAASASVASLFIRKPDVVYVYHPPATVAIPALVLRAVRGVPVVYDIQDLWPDTLAATGMLNSERALRFIGRFMNLVYRSVDRVVVLSGGFEKALVSRGVPANKITTIPNWADESKIKYFPPEISTESHKKFRVVFAGNIGPAQGLNVILDAAELLRGESAIEFILIGPGMDKQQLMRDAQSRRLDNVVFKNRVPVAEISSVMAQADALMVHLRKNPLFEITIPSKIQAYLLAGRPILMGVEGDAADLLKESGAGLCFTPENPEELAHRVLELRQMSADERASMGAAGTNFYAERLSLSSGTRRFADVLMEASWTKPRTAALKRLIDIAGSGMGLGIASIPMGIVALAVRLKLGSPVIFKQKRPGHHGEPFTMYKFRTMTDERNKNGDLLPDRYRLTRFGLWLRSTSLDELPELFNVFRGDMSLVGPRPLLMRYTEFFSKEEKHRLTVRPGITGLAQVSGRNTASWDSRLAMDVSYVQNLSILEDLRILAATIAKVVDKGGFEPDPEATMKNFDDERRERIAARDN